MELLFIWLMFPVVAAVIANAKGRSGFGWFLLGLLLGIFAVLIVACLPNLKAQAFVMTPNADGTATMIQSAPQKPKNDWVGMGVAIALAFGAIGIAGGAVKVLTSWNPPGYMQMSTEAARARTKLVLAAHDRRVERKEQLHALHDHPALVELRARQAAQRAQ